jgi:hypothetical protein
MKADDAMVVLATLVGCSEGDGGKAGGAEAPRSLLPRRRRSPRSLQPVDDIAYDQRQRRQLGYVTLQERDGTAMLRALRGLGFVQSQKARAVAALVEAGGPLAGAAAGVDRNSASSRSERRRKLARRLEAASLRLSSR